MNQAEKNAEIIRRGYAAFNAADMKTLTTLFDEHATWHTPGQNPIAGDHKGTRVGLRPIQPVWEPDGRDFQGEVTASAQG
jgi:ketosteroid isomerase-like protein